MIGQRTACPPAAQKIRVQTCIYNEPLNRGKVTHARRGLCIFLALVIILTTLADIFTFLTHSIMGTVLMMWSPGTAALLTQWIQRENFTNITLQLRLREQRIWTTMGIAVITPLAVASIAYNTAWLCQLTPFVSFHLTSQATSFLNSFGKPSLFMKCLIVLVILCGEIFSAMGEEIGWRGYLLTQLRKAKISQPKIISGIIWSLWHWPLFLLVAPIAGLPPQMVRAGIFLVTMTSLGYVSAQLRLKTGNLWPSILLHTTWNVFFLEIFDSLTQGTDTSLWTGESGIFVALAMMGTAFLFKTYACAHDDDHDYAADQHMEHARR